jgi:hypothetical protein
MKKAFEAALDREFDSTESFLAFFKEYGCFLDDMTEAPVDRMDRAQREHALRESVGS